MVFKKLREALEKNDEKYEILYYKYSKLKAENQRLKQEHEIAMSEHRVKTHEKVADRLLKSFDAIETAKADSFKVKASDKEIQRLLMDINGVEKSFKTLMKEFSLEEVVPSERFYDPELHEVASYEDGKGMTKGIILKTIKKGFKFRNILIKKPKVVVTK